MLPKKNTFNDSAVIRISSSWITCLIISILCVSGYFAFFPVVYEQNDDIWLRSIASGYFTGSPDFHLVYENNVIGYLLSFLYRNFHDTEWYALFMITAFLLSFFSNLYCILRYETGIKRLTLTLFNILLIYFLSRLQFSYITGFLAVSAVILQYYGYKNGAKKLLFFSVLLMALSSAIRFEMFLFTYFIFFAVFVFNIKKFRDYKIVYAGLFLTVLLNLFHNYQYGSEAKWKDYYEFNKARQSITANSNIDFDNRKNNEKLRLSEKDITLAEKFIFTENFSTEVMKQFSKENKKSISVIDALKFCFSYTGSYCIAISIFLVLALVFRNYKVALFILLHFILIVITMKYVNNVQYRILYPTLFGIVFFFLQNFKDDERPSLFIVNISVTGLFFLLALKDVNQTKKFALRALDHIRTLEKQLPKNKIYLVDATSNMLMYSRLAFEKPGIKTMFFGWITNFPLIKEQHPLYNSNPYEMDSYPLLISEENYKNLNQYINNKEVYIIENYTTIKLKKHSK
ncbi:hypothetical protein [Chryseobacterium luteum]|uniref:Glycosyltransferase RgtA/B/C/D-like domain-containing protein n=1 Tax=Chryseobacterium luteum TaxID=421531 RepID=A0A085ZV04_9FLAO|nr:hypothetical protein [Chryseobacterium luteum]KFF08268.1 hypothetical protein IX38_05705 [Chryseobacterium luteum]